eukprot:s3081_g1.t1
MPTFHPLRDGREARYCYCSGASRPEGWFPFRSLLKVDLSSGEVENWDAGDGCIVSEPTFLPNSPGGLEWLGEEKEDDGWLVSIVHDGDAGECRLVLLDARRPLGCALLLGSGRLRYRAHSAEAGRSRSPHIPLFRGSRKRDGPLLAYVEQVEEAFGFRRLGEVENAGTEAAIQKLKGTAEKAGAMQARLLKTSGGFHTDLMKPAQAKLEEALQRLLPKMKPPQCDVYMNFTGKRLPAGTPPSEIVPLLAKQLCSAVLWEPAVRLMIKDGMTEFYEVGPMKQLKAMMKRIDQSAWTSTTNVDVRLSLRDCHGYRGVVEWALERLLWGAGTRCPRRLLGRRPRGGAPGRWQRCNHRGGRTGGSDRQVLMNGVSGAVLRGPQDMDGETVAPSNSQRPLGIPDSVSSSGVPVDGRPAGSHQTEAARGFLSSWGQVSLPPRGVMWILHRQISILFDWNGKGCTVYPGCCGGPSLGAKFSGEGVGGTAADGE